MTSCQPAPPPPAGKMARKEHPVHDPASTPAPEQGQTLTFALARLFFRFKAKVKKLVTRPAPTSQDLLPGSAAAAMGDRRRDKDNRPFDGDNVAGVTAALGALELGKKYDEQDAEEQDAKKLVLDMHPDAVFAREQNLFFIGEALEMARLALRTNETPVGCVLVYKGTIIAKGMNATNVTRNGTRHAELMAISALLSVQGKTGPPTTSLKPKQLVEARNAAAREEFENRDCDKENEAPGAPDARNPDEALVFVEAPPPDLGNEDGSKGHLYPYGQRLIATKERIHPAILRECVLYVTVEPCVMCASLLRQFGIRKVYFGAVNDKFGGTGGVFSIHANSLPVEADGVTASAHPLPREPQSQLPDGSGTLGTSYPPGGGDGGNVEPGFEIEGGWGRDEAVGLLRRFYVQENGRAPVPRKKEGRAARLAAMMDKDGEPATGSS
ncbi:hypothetical protein CDD81_4828 [Ophiocordyceps australis]|uniref:CMP/dCMP-type deaminase domain-containing protein n=1 Tax=Ophiocordyceps australis TaxID=1399860 RepID=A0A2C5YB76_9HYPO|nr:hypothetical protein CDD81_4828 [Ophiocordyceps australis]